MYHYHVYVTWQAAGQEMHFDTILAMRIKITAPNDEYEHLREFLVDHIRPKVAKKLAPKTARDFIIRSLSLIHVDKED